MKKVMILATVAMMGMGFANNATAKSVPGLSLIEGAVSNPIVAATVIGQLKKVIVKSAKKKLHLNEAQGESLEEAFDNISDILQSKVSKS